MRFTPILMLAFHMYTNACLDLMHTLCNILLYITVLMMIAHTLSVNCSSVHELVHCSLAISLNLAATLPLMSCGNLSSTL